MTDLDDPHEHRPRLPAYAKRDADERLLRTLNEAIAGISLDEIESGATDQLPILYVVGAPRSGTTLLAQLLIGCFRVGYISNLTARFYRRPVIGVALQRMLDPEFDDRLDLSSAFGVTRGPWGQHEFGYFWRHWLQLDRCPTHCLDTEARARVDTDGLGRALRQELLAVFSRPLVLKNIICGFHATLLSRVHERSIFLHIERPERDVVRSVLNARKVRYGAHETWWSIKPPTWPFPDTLGDPVLEVVRQIRDTKSKIREELASPGIHALEVDYLQLCRDPSAILNEVAAIVARLGGSLDQRAEVPRQLTPSPGAELERAMERRVLQALGQ